MGDRILARREVPARDVVFGLLDGDFVDDWSKHDPDTPVRWMASGETIHLGWRWARKEVENYLIDPLVVARSLGPQAPPDCDYGQVLEAARDRVAGYQAARTALAVLRPRFMPLETSFGAPRGKARHPLPVDFADESLCEGIRGNVEAYGRTQVIESADVISRYRAYLPETQSGGARYRDFVAAFAGKDLLWAMNDDLHGLGFSSATVFQERVLLGISQTPENLATWLPEWQTLLSEIESIS